MFQDTPRIHSVLQHLQDKSIRFYVVSFGYKQMITEVLQRENLLSFFDAIYTPADFAVLKKGSLVQRQDGYGDMGNKNLMLQRIQEELGVTRSQILLIDDDSENIRAAVSLNSPPTHSSIISNGSGNFQGFWITKEEGLTDVSLDIIQSYVEASM